ncbi:MAG: zinc ABC transporter substrate-binding protein [Gemmataceae bacterium]|nr:zinc ABC transporter substrate-binding protein [Gemmataceae bacterium]
MNRRIFLRSLSGLSALGVATLAGCTPAEQASTWETTRPGPKVLASFAPIQCFAANVAGEDATVRVVFGDQGPHHIKDNPAHVKMFAGADLVFINSLGLEDRNVKTIQRSLSKKVPVVALGKLLPETLLIEGSCACCKEEEGAEEHDHDHGDHDPHVWMGLDQAVKMVEAIRDELARRDPAHAEGYAKRAEAYNAKLLKLKADGIAMLKDKSERQFISFHESLNYFAKNFGLRLPEVIQTNPGQEPTPKELKQLLERCEKKGIRVIAIEPQYGSGTSAKAVAEALKSKGLADVRTIVIDPLETAVESEFNIDWYETKMRANLETLAKALK